MGRGLRARLELATLLGRKRRKMARVYILRYEGTRSGGAGLSRELLRGGCICAVEWRKASARRRMGSRGLADFIHGYFARSRQPLPPARAWKRNATSFWRRLGVDVEPLHAVSGIRTCRWLGW